MKYWMNRILNSFRGLLYAFTHDSAIRVEIASAVVGLPAVYFLFDISANELLLLTFCWFFVVVVELQNSSIETALTKLHPKHNEDIGRSKDLAAAAVLWAALFGFLCLAYVIMT